jgi:LysM repeat protein
MASAEVKVKPVSDLQGATTYTVRPGDTLSGIAARCGVKIADLMAWNGISDARHLQAGQELVMASGHLSQEAMRISPQETEVPAVQVVEYSSVSDDAPESFEGVIVTEVVESHEIVLPEGFGDDSLFDNMEASEVRPLE